MFINLFASNVIIEGETVQLECEVLEHKKGMFPSVRSKCCCIHHQSKSKINEMTCVQKKGGAKS